ncbi:Crp/Fnr family transcriptional regulator [Spirosoma jeollabukense]
MNDSLYQAAQQLRQHINQFSTLSDEEWMALEPHLSIVHLKKHQLMATQGVVADQVAFVLEGVFRQFYAKDGEDWTTYFFFDQQLMAAYMSCVTGRPSPVTIEALTEATCLVFPYAVIKSLFGQYMGWQTFGRLLAEYLMVALEERMAGLLLLSPEERYMALLEGDQRHILQRVPHHYIANYLGITPVSMSRIRNRITPK